MQQITPQPAQQKGRNDLLSWQQGIQQNPFLQHFGFRHSLHYYLPNQVDSLLHQLTLLGKKIPKLEQQVTENDQSNHLPLLVSYNGIGQRVDHIQHSLLYKQIGNAIYGTGLMGLLKKPGSLLASLSLFYMSSHLGEAGHHCPIACSAGIIRVLSQFPAHPKTENFLEQLTKDSYSHNFTGAQFITEIQGGSDVGLNDCLAIQDDQGQWRITGEKWFCSNADADLILLAARYDKNYPGTQGVGLFLLPKMLNTNQHNYYQLRRLKDKLGTRTMASAEIDFTEAVAYPIEPLNQSFKVLMQNVLHLSRLYNTFAVLGAVNRAWQIAQQYALHREAFGKKIINYPLVQQNLATIQAENTALLASAMSTTQLQDRIDLLGEKAHQEQHLLLRLLANLNKYWSAKRGVEHIHHCIDVLGGNGAIESFSVLPRLLRDSIVYENWEGTHNTLQMQILRDIHKYQISTLFITHINEKIQLIKLPELQTYILQYHHYSQQLQQDIIQLQQADFAVQSLLITEIVNKMSRLYSAVCLLTECADALMKKNNQSVGQMKLDCLQWFTHHQLDEHKTEIDSHYLQLAYNISIFEYISKS